MANENVSGVDLPAVIGIVQTISHCYDCTIERQAAIEPFAREKLIISALRLAVAAEAPIPTGPTARPASAPSLALVDRSAVTPRSVIATSTTSDD